MSRLLVSLALVAVLMAPLVATPQEEASGWRRVAPGLELREQVLDGSPTWLLRVDPKQRRLGAEVREPGFLVGEWVDREGVLASLNANYFDAAGAPLGWAVVDGHERLKPNRRGWGLFHVDDAGRAGISRAASPPGGSITTAVQAGPLLVEAGTANSRLRPARARRSFVGIDARGRVVLGCSTRSIDLPTLARLLAATPDGGGLGLRDALNLDGGSSSQLYCRDGREEGDLVVPGFARVPVVLTVR
ncbi:MAG: phosphodiester glycosidase family protein [Acidobacteriota bacterium]